MAHPVVDAHIGAQDMVGYGDGSDSPMSAAGPDMVLGKTPHAVAAFALAALAGVVLLRLSGFRFAVGGSIGG